MTLTADTAPHSRRLLSTPPTSRLPTPTLAELITAVDAAGLTGRGGAGFPTATKLRAVAAHRGSVVVGNAMEGEPLSQKDAVLLTTAPHLVVEGLAIVATALKARRRVLAVGDHIPDDAVRAAAGRHGVQVVSLGGGFVSGQESALVNALSGRPGVPGDPSVRVTTRGVDGRPTLVLNAETLAQVARLCRHGVVGTSLFSISGAVARPGVVEAAHGSRLSDVLRSAHPQDCRAVLVGGYHGAWLPASALDTPLTRQALAPWGAAVGAGVLHVLPSDVCPLRTTAAIADYLAGESAGQCGPCINALPRVADTLRRLANGSADPSLPAEVARLSALAVGRGACAHPDGTVRMVASAMRVFADDVAAHLAGPRGSRCVAGGVR